MKGYYPRLGRANAHRMAVEQEFGEIVSRAVDLPADIVFLFICYTNRCGSNHLSDILAATRHFRRAREVLNGEEIVTAARSHGHRDLQGYFAELVRRQSAPQGVVTCKLAIYHLELLGDAGLLEQVIDRGIFVFMTRQDRLGQAISLEIARQNHRWSSQMTGRIPDSALVFSRSRISSAMAEIDTENSVFETFFSANGVEPVRVEYERLVEEPQEGLDMIGNQLGLRTPLRVDPMRLTLSRQRGPLNDEWRERYLSSGPLRQLIGKIRGRGD